jgi:hypothetical protein
LAKGAPAILAFNRGLISRLALARVDLKRMAFSAETQVNWMPRAMGSMMLRPGWQYLGDAPSRPLYLPFIFSTDDTALVELTELRMRVWVGDRVVNRRSVATATLNGAFDTDLAFWTDNDEAGGVSSWNSSTHMQLLGTGTAAAIRDQQVTVAAVDQGVEHALRLVVVRGPVTLRVGSSSGGDEYIRETVLGTGTHSLAFTPTGNFHVRVLSRLARAVLIDSITVESPGVLSLPTPWTTDGLGSIRFDQSGDVLYLACRGHQQRKIERRGVRSWSIVLYEPEDGPFRVENTGPITLTPSGLTGNITVAASASLFKSTHVGALFRITSEGQRVSSSISSANAFSNEIRITGVGEGRRFTITRSGTWTATVTLQRSIGATGLWEDVESYTTNDSITYADELDNQIVYYRIGIKTGDYTSGTAELALHFPLGSITGVVRITGFTSSTSVGAEVLQDLGGTSATEIWAEGSWSDFRGWPTSVAFYEGRLWWSGKNGVFASISDAFDGFDPSFEGDAGPINRTIGSGPVDDIQWLLAGRRLLVGAEGAEFAIRSNTFDEPITPTNFNIKDVSSQGSASLPSVKVDNRGIFVQRSGVRVYELAYSAEINDYVPTDLTALVPEIGEPEIVAIAVQRQPDTRLHCVRSDGVVAVAVIDPNENVLSWQEMETDGNVVGVVVLPGDLEDSVYYAVQRSLGSTGVSALTVTPGTGYTSQPTLSFSGGGGNGAAGTVTLALVSFAIAAAGSGYVVGEHVTLSGGTTSSPAILEVDTVDGSGAITAASIVNAGDYTVLPANAVSVTGGSGAGFTLNATWGLGTATVTHRGGGYSSAPTVSIVGGGGGTGGAVTATIATTSLSGYFLEKWALESECRGGSLNKQADSFIVYNGTTTVVGAGSVSALNVTPGEGYTTAPTLAFTGGGGTGAAATVGLKLVAVVFPLFTNLGSGYSVGDELTLVGGTYTRPAKVRVTSVFGSGQITPLGLTIIDPGNYTVVPAFGNVTLAPFSGGTGSGAQIWPYWGLSEATITNPGTGYTSPPTVTVSPAPAGQSRYAGPIEGSVLASISIDTIETEAGTTLIGGLNHLEGKEVVVWGDGFDLSPDDEDGVQQTYTVSNGLIVLDEEVSQAVVGLPYTAQWKSSKLASLVDEGEQTGLNQRKRVARIGFVMADTHNKGVKFGPSFTTLDNLPEMENDAAVGAGWVWEHYDKETIEFPGEWDADARVCLQAQAPRPCTMLAAVVVMEQS